MTLMWFFDLFLKKTFSMEMLGITLMRHVITMHTTIAIMNAYTDELMLSLLYLFAYV